MISPSWSSCSRLMTGAGDDAVYTVTFAPPPCGMSAMLRTFTPIVAQSSDDASLTKIETVPFWGVCVMDEEPDPPPPHPLNTNTSAQQIAAESSFVRI